jgi:Tfp pilus assembly protein PilW
MQGLAARQQGFTLIELLLYVGLVGILLGAITALFGTVADARIKNESMTEVNEQGAYVMDYIAQDIRNATSITSPTAGTASATGMTLVVPTASLSPTVFSIASGVLQVKEGAGAVTSLTNSNIKVVSMTVTNLTRSGTSGVVQVSLTLARVNSTGRNEYDYQRTFTTSTEVRP